MPKLNDDFKDRVRKLYQSIDQKYFVFKIDDLIECVDESDYLALINIMKKYNEYRKQLNKEENFYFVVNRDDFSQFNNAKEFFDWLKNKNDRINK